ncbi:hypothetical protein ACFQZ4_04280 [Catellatospora coxensis]
MDPVVALVVSAVVAGATAGISGTVTTAFADAYSTFKELVVGCLRRAGVSESSSRELVAKAADGEGPRNALASSLPAEEIDKATEDAAQRLLQLWSRPTSAGPAYRSTARPV